MTSVEPHLPGEGATSRGQPVRLSSVLYAVGKLTAETQAHRETLRELPERIVALLSPRLAALEAGQAGHDVRVTRLEERQWLIIGGLIVVASGAPILFTIIKG